MADYLKDLPVDQVAAWYRRLADSVASKKVEGKEPYASILLRHYLDNRDPKSSFAIEPRTYLMTNARVIAALKYHRAVFLSEQEARIGMRTGLFGQTPITKLVGVVPRLQGKGYPKLSVPGRTDMEYESLVQIGDGMADIARIQVNGSDAERDLFTSLRGFQLQSKVLVDVAAQGSKVQVQFANWSVTIHDRYDWDYSEHLTMPNPDFGSRAAGAVRPGDQQLTVYHSNAKRLEDAKLAAPYDVTSTPWAVSDPSIAGPGLVSP